MVRAGVAFTNINIQLRLSSCPGLSFQCFSLKPRTVLEVDRGLTFTVSFCQLQLLHAGAIQGVSESGLDGASVLPEKQKVLCGFHWQRRKEYHSAVRTDRWTALHQLHLLGREASQPDHVDFQGHFPQGQGKGRKIETLRQVHQNASA